MGETNWNPGPLSLIEADKELRKLTLKYCKESLGMKDTAMNLLMAHLPTSFSSFNMKPRGCVELKIQIDEIRTDSKTRKQTIANTWSIEVDADCKTKTQMPHYGYTVSAILNGHKQTPFTGHVWLHEDPPNYRPWKAKDNTSSFTDEKQGPASNTLFKIKGTMYNQYYVRNQNP